MSRYFSLNLSKDYVPEWGLNEVVREIGANYADSGDYRVLSLNGNLTFESEADPGIDQLLVMGVSTKRDDESTIGEFGEGGKLAALVATRLRNSSLVINSPRGQITFVFKTPSGFNTPVLHAKINDKMTSNRFSTTIDNKNAEAAYQKMFTSDTRSMIPKDDVSSPTKIYCKNVFVTELPEFKSRYHWNLRNLSLNRDRSLPSMWELKSTIRCYLNNNMTKELATEILQHPETEEAEAIGECSYLYQNTKDAMKAAFFALYGEKAIIQSDKSYTNLRAEGKGLIPVPLADALRTAFSEFIPTAEKSLSTADVLTRVDDSRFAPQTQEIARLMDLLDIPAEVRVFADMDDGALGHADWENERVVIWVNEKLMFPGHRTERIRVAIHELGHIKSRAGDETWQFEHTLDRIAAILAVKLLG